MGVLFLNQRLKIILYDVLLPEQKESDLNRRVEETISLVKTYGAEVVCKVIQKRHHTSTTSYIGREKLEGILREANTQGANLLLVNAYLKKSQIYKIEEKIEELSIQNFKVWDRVDLILQIFSNHAKTASAKLQLELAKIDHMGPRIYNMGMELGQTGAGIGTKGQGETNTEMMHRHLQNYKKGINKKLVKLKKSRDINKNRRKSRGLINISIVGYTNAGKSQLFECLTKKKTLIRDALFATLDIRVGKWYFPELPKEVILIDTIGFISDLPATLINAFKSTIEETLDADLLLHVVDITDESYEKKIETVEGIIDEFSLNSPIVIYVFNKVDILSDQKKKSIDKVMSNKVWISAKYSIGIDDLKKKVMEYFQNLPEESSH